MTDTSKFDAKSFLANLTHRPGVYRMLNAKHKVLYVGKARDLKKRVASYFHRSQTAPKTAALMQQVANVEVTVTNTEAEALILEYNLIKRQAEVETENAARHEDAGHAGRQTVPGLRHGTNLVLAEVWKSDQRCGHGQFRRQQTGKMC